MFADLNTFIRKSGLNQYSFINKKLMCLEIMLLYVLLFYFYTEPNPPTNLSAVVQCNQGYEIQIDWQVSCICMEKTTLKLNV